MLQVRTVGLTTTTKPRTRKIVSQPHVATNAVDEYEITQTYVTTADSRGRTPSPRQTIAIAAPIVTAVTAASLLAHMKTLIVAGSAGVAPPKNPEEAKSASRNFQKFMSTHSAVNA